MQRRLDPRHLVDLGLEVLNRHADEGRLLAGLVELPGAEGIHHEGTLGGHGEVTAVREAMQVAPQRGAGAEQRRGCWQATRPGGAGSARQCDFE